jgi:hypothetical protein
VEIAELFDEQLAQGFGCSHGSESF